MEQKLVITGDGSTSLFVPELDEHYHSVHGAIQESQHVFIDAGLKYLFERQKQINVLEIGFGTGLNVLLSCIEANKAKINVQFTTIEKFPIQEEYQKKLNYCELLENKKECETIFNKIHSSSWEEFQQISPYFQLKKCKMDIKDIAWKDKFDLIYFDAFAPSTQPELWTAQIFNLIYDSLKNQGILVTYCAKGSVKRILKDIGFTLEALPGAAKKREMTRGVKTIFKETKVDYIIVGQGIAGTTVAHTLIERGKKVLIIDEYNPNSSSNIAAGVVNPITGRKMVKSWMIDAILPFANQFYKKLEILLGTSFFHDKEILKIFSSEEDIELWKKRQRDVEYENYLGDSIPVEEIHASINAPYGAGIIKQGCWLDVPEFTQASRNYFLQKNSLLNERFEYNLIKISEDKINYKQIEAKGIIFCEGYKAYLNPYFKKIPFSLAKGECFIIHSTALETTEILNKNIFVIPKGNHTYSIGSTFIWDDMEEVVTESGRTEVLEKFKKITSDDFTVIDEKAAIRPTMRDRRPVIGSHPEFKTLYVFNGLGTKGVSLAPYFADYFADYLDKNFTILPEISIDRFAD